MKKFGYGHLATMLHMRLQSLRGNQPINERASERQRRSGTGGREGGDAAARRVGVTLRRLIRLTKTATTAQAHALTTLINEVLRLNGGTVSSGGVDEMELHADAFGW